MGKEIAQSFPVAKQVFEEADDVLGMALSKLCFEGPEDQLQLTANSQPALVTVSIAIFRTLQEETGLVPNVVAGHSLGEYSALVAAEALSLADALRLARQRGLYMQEAVPAGQGAMAAMMGLSVTDIEKICREAAQGQVLTIANYNGPIQTVVAGHKAAVERAAKLTTDRDGTARLLKVSAPFHCPLMEAAATKLAADLAKIAFRDPVVPIISNVDAQPNQDSKRIPELLRRQVTSAVRWEETVRRMAQMGVTQALEIGCGKVLTGLVRRIDARIAIAQLEQPTHLNQAKANKDLAPFVATPSSKAAQPAAEVDDAPRKGWHEMTSEERKAWVAQLISMDEICGTLEMDPKDVAWAITIKQMPSALVGGEWKFDKRDVAQWAKDNGGIAKIREQIRAARAEHKAGQELPKKSPSDSDT